MKTKTLLLGACLLLAVFTVSAEKAGERQLGDWRTQIQEGQRRVDEISRILSQVKTRSGGCDLPLFERRLNEIKQDAQAKLDRGSVTLLELAALKERIDLLERDVRKLVSGLSRAHSFMRRVEKQMDALKQMMQDMEGEDLQKLENILQRVSALYREALQKKEQCDLEGALKAVREIQAIGKKVRGEIFEAAAADKRIEKYIRRNGALLDKAKTRASDGEAAKALALAQSLHEKSKEALAQKQLERAYRLAVSAREQLIGLGKDLLTDDEKSKIRDRVEHFYKYTVELVERAEKAANEAKNAEALALAKRARADVELARSLRDQGKEALAMESLKRAHRTAERIVSAADRLENLDRLLTQLGNRLERLASVLKNTTDPESRRAYENARTHYEAAKKFLEDGERQKAAEEAKTAVNLLGKALHEGLKNDPAVANEVRQELERVKAKVDAAVEKVKTSDVAPAKSAAREALKALSQARAFADRGQFKRALGHLFRASSLADRADNLAEHRDGSGLEDDDTDLPEGDEGGSL